MIRLRYVIQHLSLDGDIPATFWLVELEPSVFTWGESPAEACHFEPSRENWDAEYDDLEQLAKWCGAFLVVSTGGALPAVDAGAANAYLANRGSERAERALQRIRGRQTVSAAESFRQLEERKLA